MLYSKVHKNNSFNVTDFDHIIPCMCLLDGNFQWSTKYERILLGMQEGLTWSST